MTQEAGLLIDVKSRGASTLQEIRDGLKDLGDEVTSASSKLKGFRKLWDDPVGAKGFGSGTRILASMGKAAADIVGTQIRSAADAITGPAKSTYAGALAVANNYRDVTQRIAVSTGQTFGATGKQILDTSKKLGLLPGQVQAYSSGVRSLTGDWRGAMDGLAGYQNRALSTNRTIEELIPATAELAQNFGIKSTEDVNKFFGTIDRQAKQAGITIDVAERAFLGFSGTLSSLSSAKPGQLSALTSAFMGGAPTAEMGMSRIGTTAGFLQGHLRYIEGRMKGAGKLGKGEHLYDNEGRLKGSKLFDTLEFMQKDMAKFYGTKDRAELIGRISQTGAMSLQDAAGFMNLDVSKVRAQAEAATGKKGGEALEEYQKSPDGKRKLADAQKMIKDIGMGEAMLPAQDRAVAMGGGAAGIALAASGQVFEKATGVFWQAVNIFAGKAGGGAAAAAAGSGVAGGVASGAAPWAARALGVASRGLGALGAVFMSGDKAPMSDGERPEDYEEELRQRKKAGHPVMIAGSDKEIQDKIDTLRGKTGEANQSTAGAADMTHEAQTHADAMSKMFDGKTLRVQLVQPPTAPQGQGQPQ